MSSIRHYPPTAYLPPASAVKPGTQWGTGLIAELRGRCTPNRAAPGRAHTPWWITATTRAAGIDLDPQIYSKVHSATMAATPQRPSALDRYPQAVVATWVPTTVGVLQLPSGRLVRGRGLRKPLPPGLQPDFGLYLLGRQPRPVSWESRWLRWPDFWLPSDRAAFADALCESWKRAEVGRVEIACGGGFGRTGTALACLAVLDGVPGHEAVAYVREHYSPRAVETPWQRRFVAAGTADGWSGGH